MLDLNAIEQKLNTLGFARQDALALIAEVKQLRAAIQPTQAAPDYVSLSDLIRQVEARGWLWEAGHSQGPFDVGRRFYARLWLPSLDPMHDEGPAVDEWIGWGDTPEEATQRAIDLLPTKG